MKCALVHYKIFHILISVKSWVSCIIVSYIIVSSLSVLYYCLFSYNGIRNEQQVAWKYDPRFFSWIYTSGDDIVWEGLAAKDWAMVTLDGARFIMRAYTPLLQMRAYTPLLIIVSTCYFNLDVLTMKNAPWCILTCSIEQNCISQCGVLVFCSSFLFLGTLYLSSISKNWRGKIRRSWKKNSFHSCNVKTGSCSLCHSVA